MDTCSKRLGSEISALFIQSMNSQLSHLSPEMRLLACRRLEQRCHFCSCRKVQPVPSHGSINSRILLLDSNPGRLQVEEGNAFILRSNTSKLLQSLIECLNLTLQDCFITYAFHCQTGDRTTLGYDRCSLWLNYELSLLTEVDTIVTLGEDAFHVIMGDGYPKVIDILGRAYNIEIRNKRYRVIPIPHPYFLMQNREWLDRTLKTLVSLR